MSETLTWVDADGTEHALSDDTVSVARGATGKHAPPITFTDVQDKSGAGSVLTQVRHDAREVALPMVVHVPSRVSLQEAVRAWSVRFDPTRGEGQLRSTLDGSSRDLPCRYIGGMDVGVETTPGQRRWVAVFRAFDPYWRDTTDTTGQWGVGDLGTWLPWPPVTAVADDVSAIATIVNDGDVEAWPVWTVTGPATQVTLANVTTGRTLTVAVALAAGETLTIDTRPQAKTVVDQDGTNRFSSLDTTDDDLFPFQVGTNEVQVTIVDATESSLVELAWRRRWLTA